MIIGLFLAVIFNVNTIEIVNKLSTDKVAREALVQNATKYVNSHYLDTTNQKSVIKAVDTGKAVSGNSTDTSKKPMVSPVNNDSNFNAIRLKLDTLKMLYSSTIEENNTLIGLGWGDYGYSQTTAYKKWQSTGSHGDAPEPPGFWCKIMFVLGQLFNWKKLLGFLITAMAISLGAPFWFDLLNKFVNLRASGAKPGSKSSTPVSKTALLNQKPDPTAQG